jgi:hypothetical protein
VASVKGIPAVSIGHVTLRTPCINDPIQFMLAVGMQMVFECSDVSILELRGGTHLLLFPSNEAPGTEESFDLMFDDVHAVHRKLSGLGYAVSAITQRPEIGHESFEVTEPSGTRIVCFSSHTTCATK